jgi:hypothetical protein
MGDSSTLYHEVSSYMVAVGGARIAELVSDVLHARWPWFMCGSWRWQFTSIWAQVQTWWNCTSTPWHTSTWQRLLIKHGDNFTFSNWVSFQGGRHHLDDLNVLLRLILEEILQNQPEGKIKVACSGLCLLHTPNCTDPFSRQRGCYKITNPATV